MKHTIPLILIFITLSCEKSNDVINNETNTLPTIILNPITTIGVNQVSVDAKIEDYPNFSFDKVGFCWNDISNPTIQNDTVHSRLNGGAFNFLINRLEQKTVYYIRAFAQSDNKVYYSNEIEFNTKSIDLLKEITYRFDSDYSEEGVSAIGTQDGGFIIAGNISYFFDHLGGDIILLKYNSDCELVWKSHLPDSTTNQFVEEIIQDTSGNYLVVSFLFKNSAFEPTLSKFDQSGNLLWEINVDERENDESGTYSSVSVIETSDGNYALAGNWNPDSNSSLSPDSNFSFIKISSGGELLFKENYGLPKHIEHAWTLLEGPNNNIMLIGTGPGQNNDSNMKLINLDSSGTFLWEKEYGGNGNDFPRSGITTEDGNFVIAGYSNSNSDNYKIWLMKIDWEGNVIWENSLGIEKAEIYLEDPSAIIEDSDNNLLMSATISFGLYSDMYIVKASNEGKLIWDKILNSTESKPTPAEKPKSFDGAHGIIELSNKEIIVVGHKEDEENPRFDGTTSDIWVVKMKEN